MPHPRSRKECGCGAAGVFSAPAALELYAEAFEAAGALDRLEASSGEASDCLSGQNHVPGHDGKLVSLPMGGSIR